MTIVALRHPDSEPTKLGLTAGQWGSIALVVVAIAAIVMWRSRPKTDYTP